MNCSNQYLPPAAHSNRSNSRSLYQPVTLGMSYAHPDSVAAAAFNLANISSATSNIRDAHQNSNYNPLTHVGNSASQYAVPSFGWTNTSSVFTPAVYDYYGNSMSSQSNPLQCSSHGHLSVGMNPSQLGGYPLSPPIPDRNANAEVFAQHLANMNALQAHLTFAYDAQPLASGQSLKELHSFSYARTSPSSSGNVNATSSFVKPVNDLYSSRSSGKTLKQLKIKDGASTNSLNDGSVLPGVLRPWLSVVKQEPAVAEAPHTTPSDVGCQYKLASDKPTDNEGSNESHLRPRCSYCELTFSSRSHLNRHTKKFHSFEVVATDFRTKNKSFESPEERLLNGTSISEDTFNSNGSVANLVAKNEPSIDDPSDSSSIVQSATDNIRSASLDNVPVQHPLLCDIIQQDDNKDHGDANLEEFQIIQIQDRDGNVIRTIPDVTNPLPATETDKEIGNSNGCSAVQVENAERVAPHECSAAHENGTGKENTEQDNEAVNEVDCNGSGSSLRSPRLRCQNRSSNGANDCNTNGLFVSNGMLGFFQCSLCPFNGKSELSLVKHYRAHVKGENVCSYCKWPFHSRHDLICHMDRNHSSESELHLDASSGDTPSSFTSYDTSEGTSDRQLVVTSSDRSLSVIEGSVHAIQDDQSNDCRVDPQSGPSGLSAFVGGTFTCIRCQRDFDSVRDLASHACCSDSTLVSPVAKPIAYTSGALANSTLLSCKLEVNDKDYDITQSSEKIKHSASPNVDADKDGGFNDVVFKKQKHSEHTQVTGNNDDIATAVVIDLLSDSSDADDCEPNKKTHKSNLSGLDSRKYKFYHSCKRKDFLFKMADSETLVHRDDRVGKPNPSDNVQIISTHTDNAAPSELVHDELDDALNLSLSRTVGITACEISNHCSKPKHKNKKKKQNMEASASSSLNTALTSRTVDNTAHEKNNKHQNKKKNRIAEASAASSLNAPLPLVKSEPADVDGSPVVPNPVVSTSGTGTISGSGPSDLAVTEFNLNECISKFKGEQFYVDVDSRWKPHGSLFCVGCKYSTSVQWKFDQHMKAHGGRFICKACTRACIKPSDLYRHWVTHNIKAHDGNYACDSCAFTSPSKIVIEFHMKQHYQNTNPIYKIGQSSMCQCGICHKVVPRLQIFDHKRREHGHGWFKSSLALTSIAKGKRKWGKNQLMDDQQNLQTFNAEGIDQSMSANENARLAAKMIQCPNCDRQFMNAMNLERHVFVYHNDNEEAMNSKVETPAPATFQCRFCARAFLRAENLCKHEARHVLGTSSDNLKRGENISKQPNNYLSSNGETFNAQVANLVVPDNFPIPSVPVWSNNRMPKALIAHRLPNWSPDGGSKAPSSSGMSSQQEQRWLRQRSCPHCHKKFKMRSYFEQHLRLHSGDAALHKCSNCDSTFSSLHALRSHQGKFCKPSTLDSTGSHSTANDTSNAFNSDAKFDESLTNAGSPITGSDVNSIAASETSLSDSTTAPHLSDSIDSNLNSSAVMCIKVEKDVDDACYGQPIRMEYSEEFPDEPELPDDSDDDQDCSTILHFTIETEGTCETESIEVKTKTNSSKIMPEIEEFDASNALLNNNCRAMSFAAEMDECQHPPIKHENFEPLFRPMEILS